MTGWLKKKLLAGDHVCPSWLYGTLDTRLRRLVHDPGTIAGPYVRAGSSVLDIGCGPGFFTLGLARLVGETGTVTAFDLQEEGLAKIRRRVAGTALDPVIVTVRGDILASPPQGPFDFILAFWMVHEVPGTGAFFHRVRGMMHPGSLFLMAEPWIHVGARKFRRLVDEAAGAGLAAVAAPRVAVSRAALFRPGPG